jgi:hypothetical protein
MLALNHCSPSSIKRLAQAIYHRDSPEVLFMVMTAYFDESGTHGARSPAVTLGGFIGTAAQWAAYESDLAQLFAEYGVKRFHAKELRGTKGDFEGWSGQKKAQFNARFLKLIDDHLTCGFAAVLSSKDYSTIYRSGIFPRSARPDTQYALCLRVALWKALVCIKDQRQQWPLAVVLEDGHPNAADAVRVYCEVKRQLAPLYADALDTIAFKSKNTCLPLAVADSLVYSIFRKVAGFSTHRHPDVAAVGPADPPYLVSKIPMSRLIIDQTSLATLREELAFR